MTAVRFQIVDPSGEVMVDDGVMSFPEHTTADDDARRIAADLASAPHCPPGVRVRLWKSVNLVGSLASLGEPDAEVATS